MSGWKSGFFGCCSDICVPGQNKLDICLSCFCPCHVYAEANKIQRAFLQGSYVYSCLAYICCMETCLLFHNRRELHYKEDFGDDILNFLFSLCCPSCSVYQLKQELSQKQEVGNFWAYASDIVYVNSM